MEGKKWPGLYSLFWQKGAEEGSGDVKGGGSGERIRRMGGGMQSEDVGAAHLGLLEG